MYVIQIQFNFKVTVLFSNCTYCFRSYHHLFPVEPYEELNNEGQAQYCFGCLRSFTDVDKQVGTMMQLVIQNILVSVWLKRFFRREKKLPCLYS